MPNLYFTRDHVRHDRQRRVHQPHVFRHAQPRDHLRGVHLQVPSGLQGRAAVLQPLQHVPHRGRRHPEHQRPCAGRGHLRSAPSPTPSTQLAKNIFDVADSPIDTILAFNIPNIRARSCTWTRCSPRSTCDKFTVHPGILGPLTVFEITPGRPSGIKVQEMTGTLEEHPGRATVGTPGEAHPLRRRRPHRGRARAVERRLQHAVHRPGHRCGVRAQRRHERGAAREPASNVHRDPLGRAVPRPWRPTLHEHAHLARRLAARGGKGRTGTVLGPACDGPRALRSADKTRCCPNLATPACTVHAKGRLAKESTKGMNHAY